MVPIKEALTFDDVTLTPKYSEILPSDVDTSIKLTKTLKLKIPILSSAMDTVTESKMAIEIAKAGGIGVIHRNLNIKDQIKEIKKVKKQNLLIGAAVGAGPDEFKRAQAILKENIDIIVVDTAHGHTKKVGEIIKFIKRKRNRKTAICAGNIATPDAARFLMKLGVDIIKVGIGPGSICTTRLVAGIGVPQLSAILNVKKGIGNNKTTLIADGGIKFSGDIAKALAAGADAVMIGSLFAGTDQAPGKKIKKKGKLYKYFRGMGSIGAMNKGSADRYFQSKQKDTSKYVAEGVEGYIKYKGTVDKIIYSLVGGLKSSMGYMGAKKVVDLRISVLPTSHGERIVMRLLDTRADLLDVTNIGFPKDIDDAFQKQYTRPNGILLVTGPTGSGKSTTLAAMINHRNENTGGHILTIEDPIEFSHKRYHRKL